MAHGLPRAPSAVVDWPRLTNSYGAWAHPRAPSAIVDKAVVKAPINSSPEVRAIRLDNP